MAGFTYIMVRIDEGRKIELPKEIWDRLSVTTGDLVAFVIVDDGVLIIPHDTLLDKLLADTGPPSASCRGPREEDRV